MSDYPPETPDVDSDFLSFMRAAVVVRRSAARAACGDNEEAAVDMFTELMNALMRDIALTVGSALRGTTAPQFVRDAFLRELDRAMALPLPAKPTELVNVLGDGILQLWDPA